MRHQMSFGTIKRYFISQTAYSSPLILLLSQLIPRLSPPSVLYPRRCRLKVVSFATSQSVCLPPSLFTFWTAEAAAATTRENIFFSRPLSLRLSSPLRPRFHKSSSWRPKKVEVRERAPPRSFSHSLSLFCNSVVLTQR